MRTFLLCDGPDHAATVDQIVFEHLCETDHAQGSGWSGVYSDGDRYGILWAAPVSDLFGQPEDFPELVLVDDVNDEWTLVEPDAP